MGKKYYYKAMDKDMKCNGFQFEVGETYTIDSEELELYTEKVFHFCEKIEDTRGYYNNPTDKHFLIELLGDVVTNGDTLGSNKIRIVREISRDEIKEHIQDKEDNNAKRFLALYTSNAGMLERLSKDEYWIVRVAVAENSNTPVEMLSKLAKDKSWEVREAVVENPNTSVHILEKLTKDENFYIRATIGRNLNIPTHILEELTRDKSWLVRFAVAENPNTTVYILEKLAKDEDEGVRNEAQARLKEITQ